MNSESPNRPPEAVAAVAGFNRIVGGLGLVFLIFIIAREASVGSHLRAGEWAGWIAKLFAAAALAWSGLLLARKQPAGVRWSNVACWGLIGIVLFQLAVVFFDAWSSQGKPPAGREVRIALGACLGGILFPPLLPLLLLRRGEVRAWIKSLAI